MTAILGISAFYHDSAAALLVDGQLVAAAQEERFTRCKHDERFPSHAIEYCLAEANLAPQDLDYVGFYDKPLLKFERLLESALSFAPAGYRNFRLAIPHWLKRNLHLPREIRRGLQAMQKPGERGYSGRHVFLQHHESHAASAFFPSPFDDAAVLTLDGVGEWETTCIGEGHGNKLELHRSIHYPHSLGLLYSAFTYHTGFRVNSGEYKLMGLAPYGRPVYADLIREKLIDIKSDGSFRLDMSYFDFAHGLTMTSRKFDELFGAGPRVPESPLEQRHMDLAASVQTVTEEAMLQLAREAHRLTGLPRLALAGGVALNCVGNGRLLRESPFDEIWIQPAAGDAGGALGVAMFIWHQLLEHPRTPAGQDAQRGSRLGPQFSVEAIESRLQAEGAVCHRAESSRALCETVASSIDEGAVVGWFQGRMEFGPRALGSRSILADARSVKMQSIVNQKIKYRESFRPFAPIVLCEHADQWFDLRGHESPYMLLVAEVLGAQTTNQTGKNGGGDKDGQERDSRGERQILQALHSIDSPIPAVTHVDGSARVQTVDAARDPLLHQLLSRFHERTGCPVMINTSFNVRSEPIVCTPEDAFRCFLMTEMDMLVVGPFVLHKSEQTKSIANTDREKFIQQFQLD